MSFVTDWLRPNVIHDAQLVWIAEIQLQPYRTVLVPLVSEPGSWSHCEKALVPTAALELLRLQHFCINSLCIGLNSTFLLWSTLGVKL